MTVIHVDVSTFGALYVDLFNTLVRPPSRQVLSRLLVREGLSPVTDPSSRFLSGAALAHLFADSGLPFAAARDAVMLRPAHTLREVVEALVLAGGTRPPGVSIARSERLVRRVHEMMVLMPGATRLLGLARAVHMPIVVVTDSDSLSLKAIDSLGIRSRIDAVVPSCEIGAMKPSPAIFAAAARATGVPISESLMIGDGWASDVMGALRSGASAIWLDTGRDPLARIIAQGAAPSLTAALGADVSALQAIAARVPFPGDVENPFWLRRVRRVQSLHEVDMSIGRYKDG